MCPRRDLKAVQLPPQLTGMSSLTSLVRGRAQGQARCARWWEAPGSTAGVEMCSHAAHVIPSYSSCCLPKQDLSDNYFDTIASYEEGLSALASLPNLQVRLGEG